MRKLTFLPILGQFQFWAFHKNTLTFKLPLIIADCCAMSLKWWPKFTSFSARKETCLCYRSAKSAVLWSVNFLPKIQEISVRNKCYLFFGTENRKLHIYVEWVFWNRAYVSLTASACCKRFPLSLWRDDSDSSWQVIVRPGIEASVQVEWESSKEFRLRILWKSSRWSHQGHHKFLNQNWKLFLNCLCFLKVNQVSWLRESGYFLWSGVWVPKKQANTGWFLRVVLTIWSASRHY